MKDECLICSAPLEYLEQDTQMECSICHKIENSKTRCVNGHYVCNECHTEGFPDEKIKEWEKSGLLKQDNDNNENSPAV